MIARLALLLLAAGAAGAAEHVPPDPPKTHVHEDMSYGEMALMMGMDDRARFAKLMLDEFEWREDAASLAWDAAAWYGGDRHKLWFASEGARDDGATHARTELLWDRIATRWWNTRAGWRHDSGDGPSRDWLAFGVAGLAPGFVEVEVTAYFGEGGRTALRLSADYDLLITQRLVLHPEVEINAYGRDDEERGIRNGVADLAVGLRLRYEWRREVAPYAGVLWTRHFGNGASEAGFVAGLRLWF